MKCDYCEEPITGNYVTLEEDSPFPIGRFIPNKELVIFRKGMNFHPKCVEYFLPTKSKGEKWN